jgi:predicted nucleotidyltransferase
MDDIGVNERIVFMTRRAWLLHESMNDVNAIAFHFGSQSEGSTTTDLDSDIDILICLETKQVIQDWIEWKPGKNQYLMVQDDTTSPGYCLLQTVQPDIPVPVQYIQQHEHHRTDYRGRVLLRHSLCFPSVRGLDGARHGPAQTRYKGPTSVSDIDTVFALSCPSWPKEAEPWLNQLTVSGWPTAVMKRYAAERGCFVVPVASRASVNQDTEWRISTSLAERCLMFSLNMTRIRCYILMKMIVETHIKPKCEDVISSYMCKTVLFHCVADSRFSQWNNSQLLPCLYHCLQRLFHCILSENCPHFIIPGNNLLAGKLSFQTKQQLVEIMKWLTTNIEQSLLAISLDGVGPRLHVKSGGLYAGVLLSSEYIARFKLAKITYIISTRVHGLVQKTLEE